MLAQASCSPGRRKGADCSTPSGGAHAHKTAHGGALPRYHAATKLLAQAIELHAAPPSIQLPREPPRLLQVALHTRVHSQDRGEPSVPWAELQAPVGRAARPRG